MGGHLDAQRRRRPAHTASHSAGPRVALGHVVAGDQIDGAVPVGFGVAIDHTHQVTPGQQVHLAVAGPQLLSRRRLIDSRRRKQRRHQIDMRRRRIDNLASRRPRAHPGDHERHPRRLVVQVEPLLVQPAVGAQQFSMIRRAHQHCVRRAALCHCTAHPVERAVDLGMEPVVQTAVFGRVVAIQPLDRRRQPVGGRIRRPVGNLRRGLGRQILVVGRRCGDRRRFGSSQRNVAAAAAQPRRAEPHRSKHDVMGVDEAGHQQERPKRCRLARPPACVPVFQPGHHPVSEQGVAHEAAVGQCGAMRLGPDPAGEAELVERVGVEVRLHGVAVDYTLVVIGCQRDPRSADQVGVAHMPLALVVRVVAAGPEPVAQRGHLARPQPAHPAVVGHLAEAIRLGNAVHIGVLAGEQRGPARHAGQRAGVVAAERYAMLCEPCDAQTLAPSTDLGRLVGRRGPLLVGHQDHDVGPSVHRAAFRR